MKDRRSTLHSLQCKTIEAGLVLQELILRQHASFVLIVCPASVCLQWQGERLSRFGLRFEVMTRQFVAYRRQERGFGTNPWSAHNRFIVSHALLRRPEYRDPLLHLLGDRAHKGLLILDEAHVAAPASASKYATDTDITRAIRDLAPRFDNRLFLSATPHNGHSNSFSALLEILDPVRFTRGISAGGPKELEPIMVRRLKRDLRKLGVERFPRRILVELSLTHREGTFHLAERRNDAETGEETTSPERPLSVAPARELLLGEKLKRYAALCAPASGQGRLPFIHLQQRLLSSPEAFARTLEAHAQGLAKKGGPIAAPQQQDLLAASRASPGSSTARPKDKDASDLTLDSETHGLSDEALAEENAALATDPILGHDPRHPPPAPRPHRSLLGSGATNPRARSPSTPSRAYPKAPSSSTSRIPSCAASSNASSPRASALMISAASPPSSPPTRASSASSPMRA